ncbi:hypothetical protein ES702_02410 [subsurface metagenome]
MDFMIHVHDIAAETALCGDFYDWHPTYSTQVGGSRHLPRSDLLVPRSTPVLKHVEILSVPEDPVEGVRSGDDVDLSLPRVFLLNDDARMHDHYELHRNLCQMYAFIA